MDFRSLKQKKLLWKHNFSTVFHFLKSVIRLHQLVSPCPGTWSCKHFSVVLVAICLDETGRLDEAGTEHSSYPPGWLGTDGNSDNLGCGSVVSPQGRPC